MNEFTLLDSEPEPDYDWSKPSLAMIASDEDGHGCILWTVGPHVKQFIEDTSHRLDDLGLDNAPFGISVWEGKIKTTRYYEGDYDADLVGTFRDPTPEEWKALQAGECPWIDGDWLLPK